MSLRRDSLDTELVIDAAMLDTSLHIPGDHYDDVISNDIAEVIMSRIDAVLNEGQPEDSLHGSNEALESILDAHVAETSDSALDAWCRYAASFPLLSATEEFELFSELALMKEKLKLFSPGDGGEYDVIRQSYDSLVERIASHNYRLSVKAGFSYRNKGIPIIDLIQVGNTSLLHSIEHFDLGRGTKFSTYAYRSMKDRIKNELANFSREIRVPVYVTDNFRRIQKFSDGFIDEHGRKPTVTEISAGTALSDDDVTLTMKVCSYSMRTTRLDASLDDTTTTTHAHFLEDNRALSRSLSDSHHPILGYVKMLAPQDREVVSMYYGLLGIDGPMTFEAIGEVLDLSKDRINKIHSNAVTSLRRIAVSDPNLQRLGEDFIEGNSDSLLSSIDDNVLLERQSENRSRHPIPVSEAFYVLSNQQQLVLRHLTRGDSSESIVDDLNYHHPRKTNYSVDDVSRIRNNAYSRLFFHTRILGRGLKEDVSRYVETLPEQHFDVSRVEDYVESLNQRDRLIAGYRFGEGYTAAEIASKLNSDHPELSSGRTTPFTGTLVNGHLSSIKESFSKETDFSLPLASFFLGEYYR